VIVIDASLLAKYVLREENWEMAREYLARESCSVDLALAEVSNAIWKHNVLYGKISSEEASLLFKALNKIREDVVFFEPLEEYLDNGMSIATEERIPIYDALYLAQADRYHELVTSDELQNRIAKKRGIDVEYIR